MKSQKGITLVSLIIFLITMIMVTATLSVLSGFFFSNKNKILDETRYIAEYNKFNMYFIEDVKKNTTVKQINENGSELILEDGTVYTHVNDLNDKKSRGIYRNKVKICSGVDKCEFSKEEVGNKQIITVKTEIERFTAVNEYVLKYW